MELTDRGVTNHVLIVMTKGAQGRLENAPLHATSVTTTLNVFLFAVKVVSTRVVPKVTETAMVPALSACMAQSVTRLVQLTVLILSANNFRGNVAVVM